jgi:hypothetical protein
MHNYCESFQYFYNNPGITLSPRQTHVQPSVQIESPNPRLTRDISVVNVSAHQQQTETLPKYQQIQHSNLQDEKEKNVKLGRVSYTDVLNSIIKNSNNKRTKLDSTNLKLNEFCKRLKQPADQVILQNNHYNDNILFKDNSKIALTQIQSNAQTTSKTFQSNSAHSDLPNMYRRDKRICMDFTGDKADISEPNRPEIHSLKNASTAYHPNEQLISLNNMSNSHLIDFKHSSLLRGEFPAFIKQPMVEKQPMYYRQQITKQHERYNPYQLQQNAHTQILNKPKIMESNLDVQHIAVFDSYVCIEDPNCL